MSVPLSDPEQVVTNSKAETRKHNAQLPCQILGTVVTFNKQCLKQN
jgi:hypothetical protein